MTTMKFRFGAIASAAVLATATVVGALALQNEPTPDVASEKAGSATTVGDAPIVYAGGYGLFPGR